MPTLARVKSYRRIPIAAAYGALFLISYLAAFGVRFDFRVPPDEMARFWATVPYLLALQLVVFGGFGLYRGYWQHASIRDLVALTAAATLSSLLFAVTGALLGHLPGLSRSVLLLDWLILIVLVGGARFATRLIREGQLPLPMAPKTSGRGKRTLIIGAGEAAEQLLRTVVRDRRETMHVLGLVDDDPGTHGRSLHGVRVIGTTADLTALVARHRIELLAIAIPSATGEQMRRIVQRSRATGAECKIIPSLPDLLSGRARIGALREVEIDDLLGRAPVQLDLRQVERDIAGKRILVTGGAGSIGSELARQVARFGPAQVVLLERAESPLYFIHLELSRAHPEIDVVPVIANITNAARLDEVFRTHQPDYVFHAAAYKHVPMMEASVVEAVWNNVFGTLRVAQAAAQHGVAKLVLISTDKAVNPTSVMGVTKRIAERIVLEMPSLRQSGTDFRAVRFGNVLGSDGSVVPLFKRQLLAGGPLTLTHPDVERYFMTIPEAVQLVLMAAALPEAAGRIALLEMGRPVRVLDLAEQLIRLSGLVPYEDIQIVFTGLRPGEKLQEELASAVELSTPTSVEKIRILQRDGANGPAFDESLQRLSDSMARGKPETLIDRLMELVPEYLPWQGDSNGGRVTPLPTVAALPHRGGEPRLPASPPAASPLPPLRRTPPGMPQTASA